MLVLVHHGSKARLKLSENVLGRLRRFAQTSDGALEAGGVLLGRRIDGSLDTVVDSITHPLSADRRTRTSFHRSAQPHQRLIDAAWRASGGVLGYVGEWHTHPEPHPSASSIDTRDWQRRLRDDTVDAPDVYFLIVGTIDIVGWRGDRRRGAVDRLVEITSTNADTRSS
jgi:integrative and conjugative element protein (TIGR02256 family)